MGETVVGSTGGARNAIVNLIHAATINHRDPNSVMPVKTGIQADRCDTKPGYRPPPV
jgi:hypothetical protein